MEKINPDNIFKTYLTGVPELGIFSMGVHLLETIFNLSNDKQSRSQIISTLAGQLKKDFPLFYEFVKNNLTPQKIMDSINKTLMEFIEQFKDFNNIVIVGIETIILDILTLKMPNTNFFLIPHYDQIDAERVMSNFSYNVTLISIRDVTHFNKSKSAILSYAYFCEPYGNAFVYPAVLRAMGADVKNLYIDAVGLGILGSYTIFPSQLTPISSTDQVFTKKYHLI